jgi:hypothetical protein
MTPPGLDAAPCSCPIVDRPVIATTAETFERAPDACGRIFASPPTVDIVPHGWK